MAIYEFAFSAIAGHSPNGVKVALDDGPTEEQTIGDTYSGKEVPQELIKLHNNSVQCPETGGCVYKKTLSNSF